MAALAAVPEQAAEASNPLLRHPVAQLGRNSSFEPRPAVLHFGGFTLNSALSIKLQIVNVSGKSQRVHIVPPTTPWFKIRWEKKGMVAPGMAEIIHVDFVATEWRYHYDAIRVFSDGDAPLLVPMHAYPVMNEVALPSKLDFGHCPLGEPTTRSLELACHVPIQFEYSVQVDKPHPHFELVSAPRGLVPAQGAARLAVRFTPITLGTSVCELVVAVSQFGATPHRVTVTGSAMAGMLRERALAGAATRSRDTFGEHLMVRPEDELTKNSAQLSLPHERKALHAWAHTSTHERASVARIPRAPPPARAETTIEGLRIPPALESTNAVSFVLTQQAGKLKPKDLKVAIERQREIRAQQKAEQEALRALTGMDTSAGALSVHAIRAEEGEPLRHIESGAGEGASRQLKELAFLQVRRRRARARLRARARAHLERAPLPPPPSVSSPSRARRTSPTSSARRRSASSRARRSSSASCC